MPPCSAELGKKLSFATDVALTWGEIYARKKLANWMEQPASSCVKGRSQPPATFWRRGYPAPARSLPYSG